MSGVLNVLLGAGAYTGVPAVSGHVIDASISTPSSASASVQFTSAGIVNAIVNGGSSQIDTTTDWVRPTAVSPSLYQIRATVQGGSTPTGSAVATWLALTSTRTWTISQAILGINSCTLLIELRYGSGAVLRSGSYPLTATVI